MPPLRHRGQRVSSPFQSIDCAARQETVFARPAFAHPNLVFFWTNPAATWGLESYRARSPRFRKYGHYAANSAAFSIAMSTVQTVRSLTRINFHVNMKTDNHEMVSTRTVPPLQASTGHSRFEPECAETLLFQCAKPARTIEFCRIRAQLLSFSFIADPITD